MSGLNSGLVLVIFLKIMRKVHIKIITILLIIPVEFFSQNIPFITEYVTDNAKMFSSTEKSKIDSLCKDIYGDTIAQIVVLTENDIPEEATQYGDNLLLSATDIANYNRIGRKGVDDGILIYIVKNEKKISIANGYLIAELVSDSTTSRIIKKIIAPKFKVGKYSNGVIDGIEALKKEIVKRRKYIWPEKYR